MKSINVIIPVKDEPLLQQLVDDVNQILKATPHEVIVVDKSRTAVRIKDAEVVRQRSDGLGKAVLEALPHCRGDIVVIMDGDYSHDPKELPKLIESTQRFDIILGSRFVAGGRNLDVSSRSFISKAYRFLARAILGLSIMDPMSGFCAADRRLFDAVTLNPVGYKINLELIYKASQKGYTVAEVPITFYARRAGRSKAGVMEGVRTLLFMIALRLGVR